MLLKLTFKKTILVLLSVLLTFLAFSEANVLYAERTQCSYTLNKSALKVLNNFDENSIIHFILLDKKGSSCQFDLSNGDIFGRWQIVNTQPQTRNWVKDILQHRPDAFIIFINNFLTLAQLREAISQLKLYTKSWNVNAKFLIITTYISYLKPSKDKLVIDVLNFMWIRNAFRTALLMMESKNNTVSLFSSAPFSKLYSPCREVNTTTQVQELSITDQNGSSMEIVGYTFNTPKLFMGCPLVGHTYPFPPYTVEEIYLNQSVYKTGTEVKLILLMAEMYNCSVSISNTPGYDEFNGWRTQLTNGSMIGMFEDLKEYKVDLAFAGAIPSSGNYYKLDSLNTYAFSTMSWYVSYPDSTPNWVYVLHTFTGFTWLSLALVFVLVTLLYFLICATLPNMYKEPVDLNMVGLSLGFTLRWTKVIHLKFLLFSWSLFSLHVTLMFNTKLFSILAQHPQNPGITSIEDLYASEFRTCISSFYRDFYYKQTNGIIRKILENYITCSDMNEAVELLLQNRNFSILGKDDNMAFLVNIKRERIHKISEKFITFPVSMYLTQGSIFKEPLRTIIFIATEYGYVHKWLGDIRLKVKIKHTSTGKPSPGQNDILLNNGDFIWVYFLFISGQIISCIVFLLEICYSKYKHSFWFI